ncbi:MAG: phospholipase D-like domain-containing protein [Mycoplasma sp.]
MEKKSWMFVLIIFPFIGPLIFLKYGLYPFHKNKLRKQEKIRNILKDMEEEGQVPLCTDSEIFNHLSNYSTNINKTLPNNGDVECIDSLYDLYDLTISSIRAAKKSIFLNFYIVADGVWLRTIVNELKKQADKGIQIYFLIDWYGSKNRFPKELLNKLNESNIKVNLFGPKKLLYVSGYDNSRSHKKYMIIDNEKCLYGGFNISDEYINYSSEYELWNDDGFIIKGNVVKDYIKAFAIDWSTYSNDNQKNSILNTIKDLNLLNGKKTVGNDFIHVYDSNPEIIQTHMMHYIILLLSRAKKRIWINTPYLYPTEYMLNVLISLAHAGIDIRIVTPGLPDNKKVMLTINRTQYEKLINAGIKIHEVEAFNHAKSMIIDDDISLIGSCNLDPRAMNLNYETSSLVYSKKLNSKLEESFISNFKGNEISTEINKKLLTKFDKFLVKLLIIIEPLF